MAENTDTMTQDRAMAEDMGAAAPEQGTGTETAAVSPAQAEQGASAPLEQVVSSSSQGSDASLGLNIGDHFMLGQQGDWSNGEDFSGTASSLTGGFALDGALGVQNDRAETDYADGSSTSSNVTTFSGEVSADALLTGMAGHYANGEGGSSSESGSFLGQLNSGVGVTIQNASHGSESADGSSTYASDLSIDVDADVLGVLQNESASSENDADGSSSTSSQSDSLTGVFDSDAMAQNQQLGQSDYGYEDDAIVSIDLGGGPLLGVDLSGDSLLSVDTGLSHYDDAFVG